MTYTKDGQLGPKKQSKKPFSSNNKVQTSKVRSGKDEGVNDMEIDSEVDLFLLLYKRGNKKSFLSGKPIHSPESRHKMGLFIGQFAHVLAKGKNKYPKFKMNSKNIIQLTNHEHLLLDNGTEDQRYKYGLETNCDWQKIRDLEEELKEEYEKLTN